VRDGILNDGAARSTFGLAIHSIRPLPFGVVLSWGGTTASTLVVGVGDGRHGRIQVIEVEAVSSILELMMVAENTIDIA
jgi:hypothetical protein